MLALHNRKAVITGAASGIGAATARLLRSQGAYVIGIDHREVADADLFLQVDLQKPASIDAAIAQVDTGVEILCNIAGVSGNSAAQLVLDVNFVGLRHLTEALLPKLQSGASIVNLASVAGQGWRTRWAETRALASTPDAAAAQSWLAAHPDWQNDAYRFSKEAVIVWTALRGVELKASHGIRMNAVSPGPVETRLLAEFRATLAPGQVQDSIARGGGRAGRPEEIAAAVAFLASDASAWINGENITVDGGVSMSRLVEKESLS